MLLTKTGKRFFGYRRGPKGLFYKHATFETGQSMSVHDSEGKLVGHFNFAHADNPLLETVVLKHLTSPKL